MFYVLFNVLLASGFKGWPEDARFKSQEVFFHLRENLEPHCCSVGYSWLIFYDTVLSYLTVASTLCQCNVRQCLLSDSGQYTVPLLRQAVSVI